MKVVTKQLAGLLISTFRTLGYRFLKIESKQSIWSGQAYTTFFFFFTPRIW